MGTEERKRETCGDEIPVRERGDCRNRGERIGEESRKYRVRWKKSP